MSAGLLIAIPVFVLGVFAFAVALGWLAPQRLPAEADLLAQLAEREPDFRPGLLAIDTDRRAALIAQAAGDDTLVVRALGDRLSVHRVRPGRGVTISCPEDTVLEMRFRDLTQPTLKIRLADPETARLFAARLSR